MLGTSGVGRTGTDRNGQPRGNPGLFFVHFPRALALGAGAVQAEGLMGRGIGEFTSPFNTSTARLSCSLIR